VLSPLTARPKANHEASAEQEKQRRRAVRIGHRRCTRDHRRLIARAGLFARITNALRKLRTAARRAVFASRTAAQIDMTSDGDEATANY
jgi:hypothetical protein